MGNKRETKFMDKFQTYYIINGETNGIMVTKTEIIVKSIR